MLRKSSLVLCFLFFASSVFSQEKYFDFSCKRQSLDTAKITNISSDGNSISFTIHVLRFDDSIEMSKCYLKNLTDGSIYKISGFGESTSSGWDDHKDLNVSFYIHGKFPKVFDLYINKGNKMNIRFGEVELKEKEVSYESSKIDQMLSELVDFKLNYFKKPHKLEEMAVLNKQYYDALLKAGFNEMQAMQILIADPIRLSFTSK